MKLIRLQELLSLEAKNDELLGENWKTAVAAGVVADAVALPMGLFPQVEIDGKQHAQTTLHAMKGVKDVKETEVKIYNKIRKIKYGTIETSRRYGHTVDLPV